MASYRLDSDSDEDVTEESIDVQNANKNTTWHLQDIEKVIDLVFIVWEISLTILG